MDGKDRVGCDRGSSKATGGAADRVAAVTDGADDEDSDTDDKLLGGAVSGAGAALVAVVEGGSGSAIVRGIVHCSRTREGRTHTARRRAFSPRHRSANCGTVVAEIGAIASPAVVFVASAIAD